MKAIIVVPASQLPHFAAAPLLDLALGSSPATEVSSLSCAVYQPASTPGGIRRQPAGTPKDLILLLLNRQPDPAQLELQPTAHLLILGQSTSHWHPVHALPLGSSAATLSPALMGGLVQTPAEHPGGAVKQEMILDDQSLHDIWQLLEEFSKQDGDQLKINYDGFSQELLDLREPDPCDPRDLLANWFSLQAVTMLAAALMSTTMVLVMVGVVVVSTTRVHDTFLALDQDMNGMLSRSEFSEISNRTMSPLFIQVWLVWGLAAHGSVCLSSWQRVPQLSTDGTTTTHIRRACHAAAQHHAQVKHPQCDNLLLTLLQHTHSHAIKYFFPVLDLKNQGFVTPAEIYTFFKEIHVMWVNMGEYADLAIYDVVDEILDMVKPKMATLITPEDLEVSGMSGIFFSMLADVKLFHNYNYREPMNRTSSTPTMKGVAGQLGYMCGRQVTCQGQGCSWLWRRAPTVLTLRSPAKRRPLLASRAIKYFFPVLDLKNQGFVTPAEIYTFFKEIHVMWVSMGEYADLAIYDVVDEILDMVKPKTATLITPEDLGVSGMSGIFFSMLADVKLFHNYNYRENFIHQEES
ncbi:hypothetical protein V8C86DRAFT_3030734 [Haematococcus lacustris]